MCDQGFQHKTLYPNLDKEIVENMLDLPGTEKKFQNRTELGRVQYRQLVTRTT